MSSVRSGSDPMLMPEPVLAGRGEARQESGTAKSAGRNVNSQDARASNLEARRAEAEEDRALIQAAQTGDTAAFRRLVERHQRRAFSIAPGMVRDENDARDLVQEAFLRVYRGLDRFQGGSSFFTWFYRIVTNLAIDFMRKPGRRETGHDDGRAQLDAAAGADFPFISRIEGPEPADAPQT